MNKPAHIASKKEYTSKILILLILFFVLFVAIISAISIGTITIPFTETLAILSNKFHVHTLLGKLHIQMNETYTEQQWVVVTEIRLPRVLVAALVGSSLALSGVAMQGLFRNPLVEPGFIGVSSGAAFGAVLAIFSGWTAYSSWALPTSAFVGAFVSMLIIISVWKISKAKSVAMLLLLGVGINAFFTSLTNILIASSKTEQELRGAIIWLQGGLEARTWEHVWLIFLPIFIGSVLILLFGRQLNLMLLGEAHAKTSGINLKVMRNSVLILVSFITGVAVSVSGIISFVGLVVPHMLRLIIGSDHRLLLPASMLSGAIFLILADLASRMILQPITLQVGVVSAIVGAPVFVFLILRSKRGLGL